MGLSIADHIQIKMIDLPIGGLAGNYEEVAHAFSWRPA
jgi:hypothetical protein